MQNWKSLIFSDKPFEKKAFEIFEYQFENNPVYRRYCLALSYPPDKSKQPDGVTGIPLLPVKAFKEARITCKSGDKHELLFKSSGTRGVLQSTHQVAEAELYRQSILKGFNRFYDLKNIVILGYTPGYEDNQHSSLIWMINELISHDQIKKSRFLPLNQSLSTGEIDDIASSGRQLVLFGAAFGLLDLLKTSNMDLPPNSIVIETGGMKTYRREISRDELHRRLASGCGLDKSRIHSEYGMCELLSQAYATGGEWFRTVPWMQVSIRSPEDPAKDLPPGKEGLIGIIDLANVHSCSFVLTGDRGIKDHNGQFRVLGRWNPKDLRGCNFLMEQD